MWGYIHRKTPWHIGGRDNYGLEYTEQVSSGGRILMSLARWEERSIQSKGTQAGIGHSIVKRQ